MRKYEPIDLLKLYTKGSNNGWNEFLSDCYDRQDINKLAKVRYQICAGMDDLAKLKLNDDKMNVWFVRLMKSLEITAKKILRTKYPMPGDSLIAANDFSDSVTKAKMLAAKRKRDQELKLFFEKSAY